VNDPNGERVFVRRRRRTRRHRRNRSIRRAIFFAALAGIALGLAFSFLPPDLGTFLASYLPSRNPTMHAADVRRELAAGPTSLDEIPEPPGARRVYPYSLIPGGVRSAQQLEAVFAHDPVLSAHYRGFDIRHARLVRLLADRTVFVSYRIGGKIYWTTKLVHLHAGEWLLTDGLMTMRTRCGNQISATPRMEVSPNEPKVAVLEKPVRMPGEAAAPVPPPVDFDSALQRPELPAFYAPPVAPGLVGAADGFGPVFPADVCGTGKSKSRTPPDRSPTHKKKGGECGSGGGQPPSNVPEPSSLILLSSGLGGLYLRYRARRTSNK
jgi:hypothetical protein